MTNHLTISIPLEEIERVIQDGIKDYHAREGLARQVTLLGRKAMSELIESGVVMAMIREEIQAHARPIITETVEAALRKMARQAVKEAQASTAEGMFR